jgi:hypothetical protein
MVDAEVRMPKRDGLVFGPAATKASWERKHREFFHSIIGITDCVFRGAASRTQQLHAQRMLTLHAGPRPEGHLVRHHCQNDSVAERTCCNPLHLSWGTPKQNVGDAVRAQHMTFQNPEHPINNEHSCPHCGKTGQGMIMFRWHFDNCRSLHNVGD